MTEGTSAILDSEAVNLQDRYLVVDSFEVRTADSDTGKVREPRPTPDSVVGTGTLCSDGLPCLRLYRSEITLETCSTGGGISRQGCCWGAIVSRRESNSASVRSKRREAISAKVLAGPGR